MGLLGSVPSWHKIEQLMCGCLDQGWGLGYGTHRCSPPGCGSPLFHPSHPRMSWHHLILPSVLLSRNVPLLARTGAVSGPHELVWTSTPAQQTSKSSQCVLEHFCNAWLMQRIYAGSSAVLDQAAVLLEDQLRIPRSLVYSPCYPCLETKIKTSLSIMELGS